jgi:hypothetical protein
MFVMLIGGRSSTSTREETHTTPGGYERSEEQDEWRNIA